MNPIIYLDECFPYDQLVETENGQLAIGEIYKNFKQNKKVPMIQSYNERLKSFEYKNITNVWEKKNNKLLELQFQNLTTVCTENHLFLTLRGYIKAKDILYDDKIVSMYAKSENIYPESTFLKKRRLVDSVEMTNVYDIEIEDNHNFIISSSCSKDRYGIVVHNCDKISERKGDEINGVLTHLLDEEQNNLFQDNYLSNIPIDLSKVFFVIAFNDLSKVDNIVSDRMKIIYIDKPSIQDKVTICTEKLIPEIISNINKQINVNINKEVVEYIVLHKCEQEGGVRRLRKTLEKVFNRLNLDVLTHKVPKQCIEHVYGEEDEMKTVYNITKMYVDNIIKKEKEDNTFNSMYL
jgi:hypothetical protein